MSVDENGDDGGPGRREVAYRLFAAAFEDADVEYSESDEERAPNYVVTPTGGRVNRLFVVGVLTEVEAVSDDVLRGRVVDPTGAFVLYAGQYQQDERAFLDRTEPPAFVAVTGKARTFQPEDSDRVFTSVRPESISEVDADTRDRWTVDAAEQTLDRVRAMATAIALDAEGDRLERALVDRGVEDGLADGIVQARAHYGTTPTYLAAVRNVATDAARHVAGDLDEVGSLETAPGEDGDVSATDLLDEHVEPLSTDADASQPSEPAPATGAEGSADGTTTANGAGATEASEPTEAAEPTGADQSASVAGSAATAESDQEAATASTPGETTEESATDTAESASEPVEEAESSAADADATDPAEGPGDFEPGEFELDEDEREDIESEYGTEFQSGTEVDEPGEADIETPDPEEAVESDQPETDQPAQPQGAGSESEATTPADGSASAADANAVASANADGAAATGTDDDQGDAEPADAASTDTEPADDVDLVDAVVDAMGALDEGAGADREAVIDAVADRQGADPDAVEDAIQEALMDGRCYEPDDGVLKPI